jgi:hypothetical protein
MSSDLDSLFAQASSLSVASGRSASPSSARVGGVTADASIGSGVAGAGGGRFGRTRSGGLLSSKSFSVVSVSGSDPSVCFGAVGVGNASFCVRTNCSVKTHMDSKVEVWDSLEERRIFIVRTPGSTVFAEPSVSAARVPSEVWANWQLQTLTLAEWTREFCAVEIANNASASLAEIKEESSFLTKAKDFRTPSKRTREETTNGSIEFRRLLSRGARVDGAFIPHFRLLPPLAEVEDSESSSSPGGWTEGGTGSDDPNLIKVVTQVEASLVALGEALGVLAEESHNRIVDVDIEAKLIAGALHSLSSSIGTAVELDERFEAPTLWGSTAFLADEVVRLGKELLTLDLDVKPIRVELSWLKTILGNSSKTTEESLEKMMKILGLVMQRIQTVGPELESVKARMGKVEQDQVEMLSEREAKRIKSSGSRGEETTSNHGQKHRSGNGENSMDDLLRMLGGNSIRSSAPSSPTATQGFLPSGRAMGMNQTEKGDRGEVSGGSESMVQLFHQLVADVAILKATAKDKSVKFGGLGLRSIQDCHGWIQDNFSCYRYGLIMDPLLMLNRICGDDGIGTKSNQFKTWESRSKLKITTGAEESALHAISVKRPQLFHSGKTAMVHERNKSKLNQLPTFASWKSGGEGVRNYVVKQMNVIYSTMSHEISYALGSDPRFAKAETLALRSLNDTITFLTQLMNYIDTMYERLHGDAKFTAEQAWSLTTQILDRICEELYAPKEGVAGAMTIEEPESVCCHILWATFKTHDIMATYIEKNFENHPVISAEYVKFLATNSGSEKVERLESQLSTMTEKLVKAVDESKKAVAKSDAASSKCSELVRDMTALAKKVKALEDKR